MYLSDFPTTSIIVIKKGIFSMEEHYTFALQLITVWLQFFNTKFGRGGLYSARGAKYGKKKLVFGSGRICNAFVFCAPLNTSENRATTGLVYIFFF